MRSLGKDSSHFCNNNRFVLIKKIHVPSLTEYTFIFWDILFSLVP